MSVGFISEAKRKGRHLKGRWGVAQTGQLSPQGSVEQREEWDGTTHCNVKLRPFRIRMRADHANDPKVLALIRDLELAVRAHEAALLPPARRIAARQVEEAKRRLAERITDG